MKDNLNPKNIFTRFKGLFSIGFTEILGNAIVSLFWIYLSSLLGPEKYGELFYFLAIANVGTAVSLIGSKNTLQVFVPKKIYLDSALFLTVLVIGSISSLVILLLYSNFSLSLYVLGAIIFGLGSSQILAKKLYISNMKYFLSQRFLMVGLPLLLYPFLELDGVILGLSFSFFIYVPVIISTFKTSKFDFSSLKNNLNFSLFSYVIDLSGTFSKQIDKFIIAPLLGFALLGNYQLGIQFIAVFQLLPMVVIKYTLPHDASGNPNKNLKIATFFISILFTIIIIFLAPSIIPIFTDKFTHVVEVIQILSLSLVPYTVVILYSSKIYAKNNPKIILGNTLSQIVSFVMIIIIFHEIINVNGMAIAYVISTYFGMSFIVISDLRTKYA